MAKLTQGQAKALHDKLGEDLASFFAAVHGVEGDEETPDETGDDETTEV
jgi:hypothetical protein